MFPSYQVRVTTAKQCPTQSVSIVTVRFTVYREARVRPVWPLFSPELSLETDGYFIPVAFGMSVPSLNPNLSLPGICVT